MKRTGTQISHSLEAGDSMKRLLLSLSILFGVALSCRAQQLVEAGKKLQETGVIKSLVEAKQDELAVADTERKALGKTHAEFLLRMKTLSQELSGQLKEVARQLAENPDDEFLTKKQAILKGQQGIVLDLQRSRDRLINTLDRYKGLLASYLKDPEAKIFKEELKQQVMPFTFETLEDSEQRIAREKKNLEQTKKQKESLAKELKSCKAALDVDEASIADIEQQQKELSSGVQRETQGDLFGFSAQQRVALTQMGLAVAHLKKEHDDIRTKEKEFEISLNEMETRVARMRLDALESLTYAAKSSVVTTLEQVEVAKQEAEKARQLFLSRKTRLTEDLDKVKRTHAEKQRALKATSERVKIPLDKDLQEWRWEAKKTPDSYLAYATLSNLQEQTFFFDAREKEIERRIELEEERVTYLEELSLIKETYYKVTARAFGPEEDISKEEKKYVDKKAAFETIIKSYQTRKDEIENSVVQIRNELFERIATKRADVQKQRDTVFKTNVQAFSACIAELEQAKEALSQRVSVLDTIEKSYSESVTTLNKLIGHLQFIVNELTSITIWYRPGYAISWYGIKNISSDLELFSSDVHAYAGQFVVSSFVNRVLQSFAFFSLLGLLLRLLVVCLGIFVLWLLIPYATRWLLALGKNNQGLATIELFVAQTLIFLQRNFVLVMPWVVLFAITQVYTIQDPYFYIFFYLVSIPYLIFVAYRFFAHFVAFNEANDYIFVSEDFQQRLIVVTSSLTYATIGIMFFRQAFMWAGFPRSELPTILLAINFILFQIALIVLISKEQLLSIIPARTDGWLWIRDQFDRFYYLIVLGVITVIVMSNPYVGYGRLVLFMLSGALYTLGLLRVLIWLHGFFKKIASDLFFTKVDEGVKERFSYAKTWFGGIILASFFVLGLIGLFVAAKIWNWNIGLVDVRKFMTMPLIGGKTELSITLSALLRILGYVGVGIFASFIFHRYVLKKIFDLMLVETGLQNAITSITRYLLVIVFVLIGFEQVGLGGLIAYIAVLAVGASWIVKEPLGDLIAYFIILVQRPIRVGDYIKIDEETRGVVRKITPKAVILRKKNSMTIMVPNNQIINKVVTNWNYARNFVATDDITIIIDYGENPQEIKKILMGVLEENSFVLKTPKPIVRLTEFVDFGYKFMLRAYISSTYTLDLWEISSDLRMAVAARLHEKGIAIALPMSVMVTDQPKDKKAPSEN
jgi:small-conductance mechanosensitive channel